MMEQNLKQIAMEISGNVFGPEAKRMLEIGWDLDETLSVQQGIISMVVDGVDLLEKVSQDYVFPMMHDFLDTIDDRAKQDVKEYCKARNLEIKGNEKIIVFMDDPWTIVVTKVSREEIFLRLFLDRRLFCSADKVSYISYRHEVLRMVRRLLRDAEMFSPLLAQTKSWQSMEQRLKTLDPSYTRKSTRRGNPL